MSDLVITRILSNRPDPLDVLKTTALVVDRARNVQIREDAVERAADTLAERQVEPPAWNYEYHFFDGGQQTVNYLFLLDALNFCFWGEPRWKIEYKGKRLDGYWALAASLKRALEQNSSFADAAFLAQISPEQLEGVLHENGKVPLFVKRWRNVRELGTVLCNMWEGEASRLVDCAGRDAARLARMVAEQLASFNDITAYDGHEVRLFKRAQILVTDLWGAFGGKRWGEFENIDVLTAFADYKLPQILRAWGILKYTPRLARQIDNKVPLEADSREEIEIRAATIWAVELLREALAARGRKLWSVQVDWILWQASQARFEGIKPYHRVRTVYY